MQVWRRSFPDRWERHLERREIPALTHIDLDGNPRTEQAPGTRRVNDDAHLKRPFRSARALAYSPQSRSSRQEPAMVAQRAAAAPFWVAEGGARTSARAG